LNSSSIIFPTIKSLSGTISNLSFSISGSKDQIFIFSTISKGFNSKTAQQIAQADLRELSDFQTCPVAAGCLAPR
jgi:hypothetical protein